MGKKERDFYEEKKFSISSVPAPYWNVGGKPMKKLSGSYTVEAALVMSVVLFSIVALIQFAYLQCRQTVGIMRLQCMVEILRHQEDESETQITSGSESYKLQVVKYGNLIQGSVRGDGWGLDIESRIFEPEEFIRMLALMTENEPEESGEE